MARGYPGTGVRNPQCKHRSKQQRHHLPQNVSRKHRKGFWWERSAYRANLQNVSTSRGGSAWNKFTPAPASLQDTSVFPETRISRILIEENTFGLGSPGMLTQPRGSLQRHVRSYRKARAACGGQGSCRRVGRAAVWATGISSTQGRARGTGLRCPSALLCENPRTRTILGREFLFLKISLAPRPLWTEECRSLQLQGNHRVSSEPRCFPNEHLGDVNHPRGKHFRPGHRLGGVHPPTSQVHKPGSGRPCKRSFHWQRPPPGLGADACRRSLR